MRERRTLWPASCLRSVSLLIFPVAVCGISACVQAEWHAMVACGCWRWQRPQLCDKCSSAHDFKGAGKPGQSNTRQTHAVTVPPHRPRPRPVNDQRGNLQPPGPRHTRTHPAQIQRRRASTSGPPCPPGSAGCPPGWATAAGTWRARECTRQGGSARPCAAFGHWQSPVAKRLGDPLGGSGGEEGGPAPEQAQPQAGRP